METFTINLEKSKVNLYFVGDVHEGNCNCDTSAFESAVKIIRDDPDGYWFGMGDYIDAITHFDSKRFDPSSIDPKYRLKDLKDLPNKQIEYFYRAVKPIKDKCLGLIIGNHEATYAKYNGFDVYNRLLTLMSDDDPERKKQLTLGMVAIGKIGLNSKGHNGNRVSFTIALNHGDGGTGFLPGYPVSKVYELFRYFLTEINVMGHIHQLYGDSGKYNDVNTKTSKHLKVRRVFGISGTFLQTYVSGNANYFEAKGRREGDVGFLKLGIGFKQDKDMTFIKYVNDPVKIVLG